MAIAESAPMPGRTPIRLPTSTPKNDHIRLCGCRATLKPYHRSARDWPIMSSAPAEQREVHLQRPPEDDDADHHRGQREDRRLKDRVLAIGKRRDEDNGE